MFFHPQNLKSENNNPWFKPWFNINLLHTQSIVCATVDNQCLDFRVLGIYNFGHVVHGKKTLFWNEILTCKYVSTCLFEHEKGFSRLF